MLRQISLGERHGEHFIVDTGKFAMKLLDTHLQPRRRGLHMLVLELRDASAVTVHWPHRSTHLWIVVVTGGHKCGRPAVPQKVEGHWLFYKKTWEVGGVW